MSVNELLEFKLEEKRKKRSRSAAQGEVLISRGIGISLHPVRLSVHQSKAVISTP